MPLLLEDGIKIARATIAGKLRHKYYERVCNLAKEFSTYATGEDLDDLLIQYTPREDSALFEQRKRVTQEITPDIVNRLISPMHKASRTLPNVVMKWDKSDKSQENKAVLESAINSFYGDESVDQYLSQRFAELNNTDPNAFIVVEFAEVINPNDPTATKAKPYPFEVSSEEAINYQYINNELQFLIVLNSVNGTDRYTLYLENEAVIYDEISREAAMSYQLNPNQEIFKTSEKDDARYFIQTINQHKAGRIPARRVGVRKDIKTRNRTCVPFIFPSRSYLKKSIKAVSEFDLATCLHLFPQKIQYDEVCPGDVSENIICKDGRTIEGKTCSVCGGTGYKTHLSSADIIRVKMPKDPANMVSLENYMAYKGPALDLLEFMKKYGLQELSDMAINAVYSSELLSPKSATGTATEVLVDLDSVYDALKPFADGYSAMMKHIINTIASLRDVGTGFTYEHAFPKDFKMKTLTALLDDLTKANNSGASIYAKRQINKDIVNKIYIDNPSEQVRISVKDKYYPFVGKSESEINNIITNDLTTRYNKVLYANFEQIFSELEEENNTDTVNFYNMEINKQRELLKAKVQQYIDAIDEEAAAKNANSIGNLNDTTGGGNVTQDFNIGDSVTLDNSPVEIIDANPSINGGVYTVKLQDGTEKQVNGNQLIAANVQ